MDGRFIHATALCIVTLAQAAAGERRFCFEPSCEVIPEGAPIDASCCTDDRIELRFLDGAGAPGADSIDATVGEVVKLAVVIEAVTPDVLGWSLGVEHDLDTLELVSVTDAGTEVVEVLAPEFAETRIGLGGSGCEVAGGGFFQGMVLALTEHRVLPTGRPWVTAHASYRATAEDDLARIFVSSGVCPPSERTEHAAPIQVLFSNATTLIPRTVVNATVSIRIGEQLPGDCNQDGTLTIADPVCLLGFLFQGSPPSLPCADGRADHPANVTLADANGSGIVELSDAVHGLLFLFNGGPPHVMATGGAGLGCVRISGCPGVCGG